MAFDILDRVVPGIGVERVDGIHSVEPGAPAVAALKDLHVDPVLGVSHPREGNDFEIADPGRDLAGNGLRQCLHHRVGELVAGAEASDRRRRKYRVGERAERRRDLDRTQQPVIHRDVTARGGIEQHRAHGQPHRDIDGALERHVDRPIGDLVGGAGQIDLDFVAAHPHRGDDRQMSFLRVRAVDKPVDHRPGRIVAIG